MTFTAGWFVAVEEAEIMQSANHERSPAILAAITVPAADPESSS
jgi:hypothetical protein